MSVSWPQNDPALSLQPPGAVSENDYSPPPGPPPGWTAPQLTASDVREPALVAAQDLPEVVAPRDLPEAVASRDLPEVLPSRDPPDVLPPSNLPEVVTARDLPNFPEVVAPSDFPKHLHVRDSRALPEVRPSRDLPEVVVPTLPPRSNGQRYSTYSHPSSPVTSSPARPPPMQIPRKAVAQPRLATTPVAAVTSCIDYLCSFPTTWYWHPETPEFFICSRCYLDRLHGTQAGAPLKSAYFDDGKSRICLCTLPRMKSKLLPQAIASGSLRSAFDYMTLRPKIQPCKGMDGIKGGQGHRWYQAKENAIPGFFACRACYEDYVFPTYFAGRLEPVPEGRQGPNELWACDIAMPYVRKHLEYKSKTNNWPGFITEAKARCSISKCPGPNPFPTYRLSWFVPKDGTRGIVACPACYCDQVLWTEEDTKWREMKEWKDDRRQKASCSFAHVNLKLCMQRAHDLEDYAGFWSAAKRLANIPVCSLQGIKNGQWYTLRSNPTDFAMCKACYVTIADALQVSQHFVPKIGVPKNEQLLCCFNPAHGRMPQFISKLLEVYMKTDPAPLISFASVWSQIPRCPKDQEKPGMHWYGWPGCTICRECHHEFTSKYPNMCAVMEYQDILLAQGTLCEMYSPRMRDLFKHVAITVPANLPTLFEAVAQRRAIYTQTVPQIRAIIAHQKNLLGQQEMSYTNSTFHMVKGHMDHIAYGTPYTYSAPGVGSGFANMDLLQSAAYRQDGSSLIAGAQSAYMDVVALERQWRAAE